jgi:hypothetical protein
VLSAVRLLSLLIETEGIEISKVINAGFEHAKVGMESAELVEDLLSKMDEKVKVINS